MLNFPRFGLGDLVYIVGLYRLFEGTTKISPIVHTGHIAMAPDEEIPVTNPKTGQVVKTRGYLIEAQTLKGLSGSPVFIRYTNVSGISSGMGRVVGYSDTVHLLGVWQGAWDGMSADILTEELGRERRVPVGMGITIPARRIEEILALPELRDARKELIKLHLGAATMNTSESG